MSEIIPTAPRRQPARSSSSRRLRSVLAAALVALAVASLGTQLSTRAAERDDGPSSAAAFRAPGHGYHGHAEVEALLLDWSSRSDRVRWIDLGVTHTGRSIPAVEFGAGPPGARPTRSVLLLGGVDGVSQSGGEAVLHAAHGLLKELPYLDPSLSVIVIPWGAPDALERRHTTGDRSGRNLVPVDDDEDALVDEDGPDDLDGDGLVLDMLIPDPTGVWALSDDPRFVVHASDADSQRFRLSREGRDDDGDGRFNEDGVGGIAYDAHFPIGWAGPGPDGRAGRWPLEDAVPRRIANLVATRDIAVAFLFQGNSGGLDLGEAGRFDPTAPVAADASGVGDAERRIRLAFQRATGRRAPSADGARSSGGRMADWMRAVPGIETIVVSVWGPEAVGVDGRPFSARVTSSRGAGPDRRRGEPLSLGTGSLDLARGAFGSGRPLGGADARWARWLDDVRGGAGFLNWHPVDLGGGLTGWVGGWEPRTRNDPPEDSLANALEGIPRFVHDVTAALPKLEIEVVESKRSGELLQVRARVVNRGGLGTEFVDRTGAGRVTVTVDAACDAVVAAGAFEVELDRLGPGETSRELDWLVAVPIGGALRFRATARGTPDAVREVRP